MGEAKRRKELDPNFGKPNLGQNNLKTRSSSLGIKNKLKYQNIQSKEQLEKNHLKWYLHEKINSSRSNWNRCQGFYNNIFNYLLIGDFDNNKSDINQYRTLIDDNDEIHCIAIINRPSMNLITNLLAYYFYQRNEDSELWKKYQEYFNNNSSKIYNLEHIAVAPWHLGKKTGIGTTMLQEIIKELNTDIISEVLFDTEEFFIKSGFQYLVPSHHENQSILIYSKTFHTNPLDKTNPYIGYSNLPQLDLDFEKKKVNLHPLTEQQIKEDLINLRQRYVKDNNQNEEEYFIEARKIISTYIKGSSLVQPDDYSKIKNFNPKVHNLLLNLLTALILKLDTEIYMEYGLNYSMVDAIIKDQNQKADFLIFPKIEEAIKERKEEIKRGNNETLYISDLGTAFVEEYKNKIITLKLSSDHVIVVVSKEMCAIQFCVNALLNNVVKPYIGVVWFFPLRWRLKYKQKIYDHEPLELLITPWEENKYKAEDNEQVTPFQIVDEGESLFTVQTEESLIKTLVSGIGINPDLLNL